MTPDPSVGAGADRVLYVLATLARHDGPLSIAALAEQTGLAQSTLYRQVALLAGASSPNTMANTDRGRSACNWPGASTSLPS